MIELALGIIVGVIVGALLGYHFAMDAILRFTARRQAAEGKVDPAVSAAIRSKGAKPVQFHPTMTDQEVGEMEGNVQDVIRGKIKPSAKQVEEQEHGET